MGKVKKNEVGRGQLLWCVSTVRFKVKRAEPGGHCWQSAGRLLQAVIPGAALLGSLEPVTILPPWLEATGNI